MHCGLAEREITVFPGYQHPPTRKQHELCTRRRGAAAGWQSQPLGTLLESASAGAQRSSRQAPGAPCSSRHPPEHPVRVGIRRSTTLESASAGAQRSNRQAPGAPCSSRHPPGSQRSNRQAPGAQLMQFGFTAREIAEFRGRQRPASARFHKQHELWTAECEGEARATPSDGTQPPRSDSRQYAEIAPNSPSSVQFRRVRAAARAGREGPGSTIPAAAAPR
jgi:hypothetical protein